MTFSAAKIGKGQFGGLYWKIFGYFSQAMGDTGGDIDTGLRLCFIMRLEGNSTAATSTMKVDEPAMINGNPVDGSAVTIVTSNDIRYGFWTAIGKF